MDEQINKQLVDRQIDVPVKMDKSHARCTEDQIPIG